MKIVIAKLQNTFTKLEQFQLGQEVNIDLKCVPFGVVEKTFLNVFFSRRLMKYIICLNGQQFFLSLSGNLF